MLVEMDAAVDSYYYNSMLHLLVHAHIHVANNLSLERFRKQAPGDVVVAAGIAVLVVGKPEK